MRIVFALLFVIFLIVGCTSNLKKEEQIVHTNVPPNETIKEKPVVPKQNIEKSQDQPSQIPQPVITEPQRAYVPPTNSSPSFNQKFTDPTFGTTLRRITDRASKGGFGTHIYSQLQAFSDDDEYILLVEDGEYLVKRRDNANLVYQFPSDSINAPRWQPARKHTIVHYDSNADTMLRVQYTNVDTGSAENVFTFPSTYERIVGNPSFDELSYDGKWMAGLAQKSDGSRVIFVLDLEDKMLMVELPLPILYTSTCTPDTTYGIIEPDWISVSPLGNYLVVQWPRDGTTRCNGLETFNIRTGAFIGRVSESHQHGDLGVMPDGKTEFFMTFDLYHPSGAESYLGLHVFPGTTTMTPVLIQALDWNGEHISCQTQGACVITTRNNDDQEGNNFVADPFDYELFLQCINGSVVRLAHHHSTSCDYWAQPRASISKDGKYVIFASDWGINDCRSDAYVVEVPR